MLMSVSFICLCNSMHCKLRCAGNFNRLKIYVPAEVMPASVFAALHSRAPGQLHFRHRVPYSSGWIVSPAARSSWHWISWRLLPLKPMLNDYYRCVVIWQQENGTELGCPYIGGYFWNWTVTFCLELNCELKYNLFLVVEQRNIVAETAFLTYTDLLSVVISRTTLTYKNVKTKTKIELKLKLKWYSKLKKLLATDVIRSNRWCERSSVISWQSVIHGWK